MPAPAPQATSSRRCSSVRRPAEENRLAKTAPACFGAPSRPSAAPMPTMTIDSTALAKVRNTGRRPAPNQIAAVISMLLPLERRTSAIWPTPVMSPAMTSTATWCHAGAVAAASSSVASGGAGQTMA